MGERGLPFAAFRVSMDAILSQLIFDVYPQKVIKNKASLAGGIGLGTGSLRSGAVTDSAMPNRPRVAVRRRNRTGCRQQTTSALAFTASNFLDEVQEKYKKRRYTKCDMTEHHWCPSGSSPRPRKRVSRLLQSMDGRPTITRPYRPHLRVPGRVGRFEE